MGNKITESEIEKYTIELLEKQGYQYIYAPSIAPDSETPERQSFEDVLIAERLRTVVGRINPAIPADIREDAIKQIQRLNSPELIANNEAFHRMLTEGIKVTYQVNGHTRGDLVWLVDFKKPENNDFLVVNQFTVIENNVNKRPDVILFVNGLPLIVVELKNPADENATIRSAFKQLQTYKQAIPSLFTYNSLMIISDGLEAKAGSISAGFSRFMAWKTSDGKVEASPLIGQLETLIKGMLNKKTLLDLIRHFNVFEKSKKLSPLGGRGAKPGIITIETVKKLASYHQYYAVNRAVESTLRASGYSGHLDTIADNRVHAENVYRNSGNHSMTVLRESPEGYGLPDVKKQPKGDRKGGVVWHTQGSGKSLSMVFYTGKIVLAMENPTILVITDRNDLDDQLYDTFASSKQLLRQEPVQAKDRGHLKELLKVASGGVVFATIQKFQPDEGNVYKTLSERENIIVIADEAHRTQYGFKAKTIDDKDADGNVIGKKIVYGFAKYMRDALPNATYLGFTGTPIESTDVNTPAVFGNYVDVYDISQAVEDGATVRIYYESRLAKISLSIEGKKLVSEMDDELEQDELTDNQKAKAKWTQLEALIGSKDRIKHVARDIIDHYTQRQEVFEGKAMIVAMSRRIAADLYKEIINIKPEWHNDDLKKGVIKVVMTSASSDGPEISRHHTTKDQRRALADRMRDPDDELGLVTDKVIDIFGAAGIKKPDISILSEDFLLEVKNMEHKNIALEVLKKLLNDEIKTRTKKNLIQSKSLMEMLENSIKRYHAKILTAAEVIEELINLSKEIHDMDKEPGEMGLSDYEYAFYTAIANNDSAKELMTKDKLRELAVVLFEKIKANASIDWTIKESVKAKLKVIVKRTLRQFGYPPDMQKLATETVLKQAELIAEELIGV